MRRKTTVSVKDLERLLERLRSEVFRMDVAWDDPRAKRREYFRGKADAFRVAHNEVASIAGLNLMGAI